MTPKVSDAASLGEEYPSVVALLSDLTEDNEENDSVAPASLVLMTQEDEILEDKEEILFGNNVSREDAFERLWTDPSFHDLTLEGSDGLKVPVNSYALAARNQTIRAILSKNKGGSLVKMKYPGAVIHAMVKYIHTDNADVLESIVDEEESSGKDNNNNNNKRTTKESLQRFQTLLLLLEATKHFKLSPVEEATRLCLLKLIGEFPALSFATIEACRIENHVVPPEMEDMAMSAIQSGSIDLSHSTITLGLVSQGALEKILTANESTMDNQQVFALLHAWVEASVDGHLSESSTACRSTIASCIIKTSVDLSGIDPVYLSTTVASSGLATPNQLGQAYLKQALAAKQMQESFCAAQQQLQRELAKAKEDVAESKQVSQESEEVQSKNEKALHEANERLKQTQQSLRTSQEELLQTRACLARTQEKTKKLLTKAKVDILQTKQSLERTQEELDKTKTTLACKEAKESFNTRAKLAVWQTSGSKEFGYSGCNWKADTLQRLPKMTRGSVCRWTIRIESSLLGGLMLGIAKNPDTLRRHSHIGSQESNGWGYDFFGRTYHACRCVKNDLPRISRGSEVTLELNLLPGGDKSGTLSASIDGGEYFEVFDGLLDHLTEDGFVPAASLYGNGNKIRLCSIEMLRLDCTNSGGVGQNHLN